jgi:YggT family protein
MYTLIEIIDYLLTLLFYVIMAQVIISWLFAFNVINHSNDFVRQIVRALDTITEPLYRPIRRILPDFGGLDFSPLVVLVVIQILQRIVLPNILMSLATQGIS